MPHTYWRDATTPPVGMDGLEQTLSLGWTVTSILKAVDLRPQTSAAQTMKEDPHQDGAALQNNDRGTRRLLTTPPAFH